MLIGLQLTIIIHCAASFIKLVCCTKLSLRIFMKVATFKLKVFIVLLIVLPGIAMLFSPPLLQNPSYHQFADQRCFFAIPNYCNVISNIAFLAVGTIGLYRLYKNKLNIIPAVRFSYLIFFISISLVCFGSAYYHWQPNNFTLFWDRLPMVFSFMSLTSFVLAEYLSVPWGRVSLFPLLLTGLLSVCYWYFGELHSSGDLRLYVLVQFVPLLLLLVLLGGGQQVFQQQYGYWHLFIAYLLAKLAEHFDASIFTHTSGIISGHTLKHLLSAAGLYLLILYFEKRIRKNTCGDANDLH
jgi:hypothetical protein